MDPPPPSTTTVLHHHYQDSIESSSVSSPTCRQWGDTLPPPKLRMMCSYGGHIIPRPRDKTLCYMGGETRIVVADRHTSLAELCSRLSTTLLNGRNFILKYQLPTEDLDSLVSITTDEDLDNMVEEYDRLNVTKPSRLRLFLFPTKPETAASMGSLLEDAKSETWFVDALNGAGLLPRGLSDPSTIDNLLEHKDNNMESDIQRCFPLLETTSSFGSTSSSPSTTNLPPIKVKVDHMNQIAELHDEQLNMSAHVSVVDDQGSDHGAGMRKPPLPLQPVQRKFGHDVYSLASPDSKHGLRSPDSITSDSSIASAKNRDTPTPPATTQIYPINFQISDPSDTQPPSLPQDQQFYPHFIQHQPPQPLSSFYSFYPTSPQITNQQYPSTFFR